MKKRGYMIIEVLISIAVAAILITALLPIRNLILRWFFRAQFQSEVNNVINFINVAKAEARRNNNTVNLRLDNNSITLYENTVEKRKLELSPQVIISVYTGPDYKIKINNIGNIASGGASIVLTNTEGKEKTVTIKVGTGYVSEKR